ncbi:hypothetical protein [Nocardioides sp. LML1-1-1.1]|uniref:hypothetical protein n=1 Tax=Nocardioides sp. LML1-1-1.1 TaxID=3135248 RepID=UPI003449465E
MMNIRRLVATLGLSSALVLSSAGIASAQRWVHADPSGDAVTFTDDETAPTVAPDQKQGDVVQTTISHTRTKVVIRVRMRAIPRDDWMAFGVIRTPRASFDLIQMKLAGGRHFGISKGDSERDVRCAAKSSRIDRTALVFTVARSCLGNPRWIRAGVGIATFDGSFLEEDEDDLATYADDALRRSIGEDIRLSPRLRRG